MREAEVELQSGGSSASTPSASNIKSALESLKKGKEAIAERQNLIKIADQSELGWAVVNEYTADELADNSDDEKRMEKAEKAAERKAARKRKAPAEKSKASKRSASAMVPAQTFQPHAPVSSVPVALCEACSSSAIHAQDDAATVLHLRADGAPQELLPKDTSLQQ